jgi:hypothetical protein
MSLSGAHKAGVHKPFQAGQTGANSKAEHVINIPKNDPNPVTASKGRRGKTAEVVPDPVHEQKKKEAEASVASNPFESFLADMGIEQKPLMVMAVIGVTLFILWKGAR